MYLYAQFVHYTLIFSRNPIPDSKSRWTEFDVLRDELTNTMKGLIFFKALKFLKIKFLLRN